MEKGDIVEMEFDAYIKETDELIETTHEELANEHDIFEENREYKPIPVIAGNDKALVEGLNEHMLSATVGKEMEVNVPSDKGYGVRDPKLVELHSRREILRLPEFSKGDQMPYIGMQIILKNKPAWISSITAGRVRIDFNHRLAGKTLLYKYKITKKLDKLPDKVQAILAMHYASRDEFKIDIDKKKKAVDITLPDICKYDNKWTLAKYGVIANLREVTEMEVIRFVEEYVKKEEPKEEAKNTEATLETAEETTDENQKGSQGTEVSKDTSSEEEETKPEPEEAKEEEPSPEEEKE